MGLLDSSFAPLFIILAIFGVLAGFFRHLLAKVLVVLAVEVILFVLFPNLLVLLAELVAFVRRSLG